MSPKTQVSKFMYCFLSPKMHQVKEVEITEEIVHQADVLDLVAERFIASLKPEVVNALNGRLERGLTLAKSWSVVHCPERDKPRCYRVRSSDGSSLYKVDLDARSCECPDSQKGNTCKHRIAAYYVEQALYNCEPRIELLGVDAKPDREEENRLSINIEYRVIATNTIFNLVYPFYLTEGGGL